MKVSKKFSNGGYHITVEIGGKEYSSYWSAPGDSIDHAGLQYITDRYPIIKTEKRAVEFKRLYKNLWLEAKQGKYLVITTRHKNMYGDGFALFWGQGNSEGGYNCDPRTAHRFTEEEIKKFDDRGDIAISIDKLGLTEKCETGLNPNLRCLVELGTINQLYNLRIKK